MDPASTEEMRAYWDSKARENAYWYIHSVLKYQNPDEAEFWRSGDDNLLRTLEPLGVTFRGDERVVEIGCGVGRMTRALAGRTAEVVGVDVSAEMVERARQHLADVPNVSIVLGNGRDLVGLDDDSFDAAYSFIVFQHIPDPAVTCSYIREMGRVLRPSGWAVFQISDDPKIHLKETYKGVRSRKERLKALLGREHRGTMRPQWLGSAVPRPMLLEALAEGGLELVATYGDGTQFCFVHARKPESPTD